MAAKEVESAIDLYLCMTKQWGLQPDPQLYTILISGCMEAGAYARGRLVHGHVINSRTPVDSILGTALINMYCKEGTLDMALAVFDSMGPSMRDTAGVWTPLISGYAKVGDHQKVMVIFEAMLEAGVPPDGVAILALLPACPDLQTGKTLHAYITRYNIPLSASLVTALIAMYTKFEALAEAKEVLAGAQQGLLNNYMGPVLIDMHAKGNDIEAAMSIFDTLKGIGKGPDVGVWNAIIAANVKCGRAHEALALYRQMMDAGRVRPDSMTFLSTLPACKNLSDVKDLHHRITLNPRVALNDTLRAALIDSYANCGALDLAMQVFHNNNDNKNSNTRGVNSWNAIIRVYVKRDIEKSLQLFDDMVAAGVPPDRTTYLTILPACGFLERTRALERGKDLHAQIIAKGIPMDDSLAAALIRMYGQAGGLKEAKTLFEEVKQQAEVAQRGTWTAMIGAYEERRLANEALSLFEEMLEESGRDATRAPDAATACAVLKACSYKKELAKKALDIVSTIKERMGKTPDSVFYHNCVVEAFGNAGRLEEAEAYLLANRSRTDLVSWTTLSRACHVHGDVERAKRVEQQLQLLLGQITTTNK